MKQINLIITLIILSLLTSSCNTAKEAFVKKKSTASEEFLIEKKSPLVLPPSFNELPAPSSSKVEDSTEKSSVEILINKNQNENEKIDTKNSESINSSLEQIILKKIIKN